MHRQVDLDMIELIDNKLTVDEYLKLRALVGWKKLSREQAQKALDNSLLVVGAYLAGQPIGMGRLVGNGATAPSSKDRDLSGTTRLGSTSSRLPMPRQSGQAP